MHLPARRTNNECSASKWYCNASGRRQPHVFNKWAHQTPTRNAQSIYTTDDSIILTNSALYYSVGINIISIYALVNQ